MLQSSVSGPDPLVDQIIQIRQKRRTLGFDDRRFRTVQIHQIGDLGRHESGRTSRASQEMLLNWLWIPSADGTANGYLPIVERRASSDAASAMSDLRAPQRL